MAFFKADWNPATARLILIGFTLQITLVAIFSFMEAFSNTEIASKTFGLYTEPRMITKKPKKPKEKKADSKKKGKKKKGKKKKKKKKKDKKKKEEVEEKPEEEEKEAEEEKSVPPMNPEASEVEKSAKPLFDKSVAA